MSKLAGFVRSGLLGLLLALLAFSYSLATPVSDSNPGAASRGFGSIPLRFANPPHALSTDLDLGDIVRGSNFARNVRAIGGIPAYRFVSSSRTNHALFSEQLDNPVWEQSGTLVVTPNAMPAPDGTQTAERLTERTAKAGTNEFMQAITVPLTPDLFQGKIVVFSIFLKAVNVDRLELVIWDDVNGFNVKNVAPDISADVWTRVAIATQIHSSAKIVKFGFGTGSSGGDAPRKLDFAAWGAQFELGNTVTDYIQTTTVPVTGNPFGILVSASDVIPDVQTNTVVQQGVTFGLNGLLSGATSNGFNINPIRFQAAVVDSAATPTSGTNGIGNFVTSWFRLTIVDTNEFRFAVDNLADGLQLQQYSSTMSVVNESSFPLTFTASNVTIDGTPTTLEELGLSLSGGDGKIYGKPLRAGEIRFVGTATNSRGVRARGRNGSGDSQVFTIRVQANEVINSELFVQSVQIRIKNQRGTVRFAGYPHLNSTNFNGLFGSDIELRVGKYLTPLATAPKPVLQGFGTKIKVTRPPVAVDNNLEDDNNLSEIFNGKFSTRGLLSIDVRRADFRTSFDEITRDGKITLPVFLRLGGQTLGMEALEFDVKVRNGVKTLTYNNQRNESLSGAMMLRTVRSKESKTEDATAFLVGFIAKPRKGASGFGGANSAVVSVGLSVEDTFAVQERNGRVNYSANTLAKDRILKLSMNARSGLGHMTTGLLTSAKSGIPHASPIDDGRTAAGVPPGTRANFPVNITLRQGAVNTFVGENGLQIFSRRDSWGENPGR
ncbi:MAG TPA: hypothetical protein VEK08_17565 [Planctomycetota bacterium]|nr:hypothetical protein [Planctomycetota bacterium]